MLTLLHKGLEGHKLQEFYNPFGVAMLTLLHKGLEDVRTAWAQTLPFRVAMLTLLHKGLEVKLLTAAERGRFGRNAHFTA